MPHNRLIPADWGDGFLASTVHATAASGVGGAFKFDRGENHGISVLYKDVDSQLYPTYSGYNRGIEVANGAMGYFDLLPKGRAW